MPLFERSRASNGVGSPFYSFAFNESRAADRADLHLLRDRCSQPRGALRKPEVKGHAARALSREGSRTFNGLDRAAAITAVKDPVRVDDSHNRNSARRRK